MYATVTVCLVLHSVPDLSPNYIADYVELKHHLELCACVSAHMSISFTQVLHREPMQCNLPGV